VTAVPGLEAVEPVSILAAAGQAACQAFLAEGGSQGIAEVAFVEELVLAAGLKPARLPVRGFWDQQGSSGSGPGRVRMTVVGRFSVFQ
jgi:hypothetical protein